MNNVKFCGVDPCPVYRFRDLQVGQVFRFNNQIHQGNYYMKIASNSTSAILLRTGAFTVVGQDHFVTPLKDDESITITNGRKQGSLQP